MSRSIALIALSFLPAVAFAGPKTSFKKGTVHFTQGGKETSWPLATGELEQNGDEADFSFEFTPDGKPSDRGGSLMSLTFMKAKGGAVTFTTITVINAPNPVYNAFVGMGNCKVSGEASAKGVKASGGCEDKGRPGVVTKLSVDAQP